eukprot:6184129-Pleurochrysis_carterae.AAC.2
MAVGSSLSLCAFEYARACGFVCHIACVRVVRIVRVVRACVRSCAGCTAAVGSLQVHMHVCAARAACARAPARAAPWRLASMAE